MPGSDNLSLIGLDLCLNGLALILGLVSIYCYAQLKVLHKPPGCLIIVQQILTLMLVILEIYEAIVL